MDIASETARRTELWQKVSGEGVDDIEPSRLRDLGIYGGAQATAVGVALSPKQHGG